MVDTHIMTVMFGVVIYLLIGHLLDEFTKSEDEENGVRMICVLLWPIPLTMALISLIFGVGLDRPEEDDQDDSHSI